MTKDKLEFLEEYGGTIHEQSYSISMDTEGAKAALTDYGKQEAIALLSWVGQNGLDVTQGCPHLDRPPEELYTLYQSKNK